MHSKKGLSSYGEDIGVLMLDADFPRPVGDVGNADTFEFPVKYRIVKSCTPDQIVAPGDMARNYLPFFVTAAKELEKEGVRAIVTSCGFLAIIQDDLASSINIPLVTSSLMLVPMVSRMIGQTRKVGILTANAKKLSEDHLRAVGIDGHVNVIIKGMEDSAAFYSMIFEGKRDADFKQIGQDVFHACQQMKYTHPEIDAFVFECTNLQPYAEPVQTEMGIPVFGIIQAVNLLKSACGESYRLNS